MEVGKQYKFFHFFLNNDHFIQIILHFFDIHTFSSH